MADGIIFDLDGTLWDASEEILKSWNSVAGEETGEPISMERLKRELGKPMDTIFFNLFPKLGREGALALLDKCSKAELAYLNRFGAKPYDGVTETLAQLSGRYALYIVSNCQTGYIDAFMDHYELRGLFSGQLCFGDTGLSKAQNIAELIGDEALERAIYVGDTQLDAKSAAECGIPFIYASYGFGDIKNAERPIGSFCELVSVADEAFGHYAATASTAP